MNYERIIRKAGSEGTLRGRRVEAAENERERELRVTEGEEWGRRRGGDKDKKDMTVERKEGEIRGRIMALHLKTFSHPIFG